MSKTYKIKLTAAQWESFEERLAADPVDDFGRLKDRKI
jgi:hypothetical protein